MPLSRFPKAMDDTTAAVLRVGDLLRHITTSTGDLPYRTLDELQAALRDAKTASYAVLAEGAKSPEAAEAHMASVGGPLTLADFEVKAADIETKAAAFNTALAGLLSSLSADELIGLDTVDRDGLSTKAITRRAFVPAAEADPFRVDPAVSDLLAAFEAVGA